MARPLRIEYPNAFYHVMSRGLNRQAIYLKNDDCEIFLDTLKETCRLFGIRTLSYCLMPNHYHLLLTTPQANLSRAMRHLNGVYTQRFNRLHKKDGPLFRGRYKAILVQEDEYLTHLIRYIHLNPTQANLAKDPKTYPWSSHMRYLKAGDQKPWLYVKLGLSFFSGRRNEAIRAYGQFIREGIDPKTHQFYSGKNQASIFGDPDFLKRIREKHLLTDQKLEGEIPEKRRLGGQAAVDRIKKEVARAFKKPIDILYQSKRGQENTLRMMALSLSRELSGLTLPEIAQAFHTKSYKTVGTACYRVKVRMAKDPGFKQQYSLLYKRCSQEEI